MVKFRTWLENLELQQTIPPDERHKNIWVDDEKNPEKVDYWKKLNTKKVYRFPLSQEKFIHFTLKDYLPDILENKELKGISGYPTYGISLSYGIWLPIVQYDHIIRKKNKGDIHPKNIKKLQKIRKNREHPEPANLGKEIVAILFRTDKMPYLAHAEEVVWDGNVPLKSVESLSSREAIRMLKHTPYSDQLDHDNDTVEYYSDV